MKPDLLSLNLFAIEATGEFSANLNISTTFIKGNSTIIKLSNHLPLLSHLMTFMCIVHMHTPVAQLLVDEIFLMPSYW